tara:strand:+ start:63 stop:641 length:579 start_codon:yes stop_codon:yes gene_type:complete
MSNKSNLKHFITLIGIILLTACSQNLTETFGKGVAMAPSEPSVNEKGIPQTVQPAFAQFQDIPIPEGVKMNMDRTIILGENNAWIGRLVIDSQLSKAQLFDFFKYRTSQFGWQEITSVRASISVLSYSKANRIMTITFQSQALIGTRVNITMSPKGMPIGPVPMTNSQIPGDQIREDQTIINPASLRPVEVQ